MGPLLSLHGVSELQIGLIMLALILLAKTTESDTVVSPSPHFILVSHIQSLTYFELRHAVAELLTRSHNEGNKQVLGKILEGRER